MSTCLYWQRFYFNDYLGCGPKLRCTKLPRSYNSPILHQL